MSCNAIGYGPESRRRAATVADSTVRMRATCSARLADTLGTRRVHATTRDHLRKEIDAATHDAAKQAIRSDDRPAIAALVRALATGETDMNNQSRDVPLEAIAQAILATGASDWTITTYSDRNKYGISYYFEVSKFAVAP